MSSTNRFSTVAIILAAGNGSRMNSSVTKQRMCVCGESVLHRAVRSFDECERVTNIVVVAKGDELEFANEELKDIKKLFKVVEGGRTRAESAKKGFESIPTDTEYVAIHDAARCLITPEMIGKVFAVAYERGAASASAPVFDTVKVVDERGKIVATPPRGNLRLASTPQVFSTEIYRRALDFSADLEGVTDDNMLVERIGVDVFCVDLGTENIKITTAQDVRFAEMILEARRNV